MSSPRNGRIEMNTANRQIDEADWTLFKTRMPIWRERYLESLLRSYQRILSSDKTAEERFYSLNKRMNKDSRSFLFSVEMRRSQLLVNIQEMLREGIIDIDDLEGFSQDLREKMKIFKRK